MNEMHYLIFMLPFYFLQTIMEINEIHMVAERYTLRDMLSIRTPSFSWSGLVGLLPVSLWKLPEDRPAWPARSHLTTERRTAGTGYSKVAPLASGRDIQLVGGTFRLVARERKNPFLLHVSDVASPNSSYLLHIVFSLSLLLFLSCYSSCLEEY